VKETEGEAGEGANARAMTTNQLPELGSRSFVSASIAVPLELDPLLVVLWGSKELVHLFKTETFGLGNEEPDKDTHEGAEASEEEEHALYD